jgi:hypothetical protein
MRRLGIKPSHRPSLDPVGLVVTSPALPKTVTTTGGREPIEWVREAGDGLVRLPTCEDGEAAFRAWSEEGIVGGIPKVTHVVCVFETEEAAADAYDSQSLPELAGENWENFEPGSEAATVPTDLDSLDMLSSDEWELGCGVGDPDIACSAWMFRARYGRVLTDVEFFSSPGEISFDDMRELVKSIDPVVARGA